MKRRDFIQKTGLATAGLMASSSLMANMKEEEIIKRFGFQAYTVRDVIYKDMAGTLKSLRKAGYNYMELFDFQEGKLLGKPLKEAKAIIDKSKIKVRSIHVATGAGGKISGTLNHEFQRAVDEAAELGAEYIVIPYLTEDERKTLDQYKALADQLNKAGETCQKSGLQVAYHNHEFEFVELEGQVPYDVLLKTDPFLVKMELDLYWTRFAGKNPLTLFREHRGRFPLWHVKDLSIDEGQPMTEVGNGIIDWEQLFRQQKNAGLHYFFVEQDANFAVNSVESLKTSIKHLKKLTF